MPIKRIIAFDFDDTLAHTVSTIGIRRILDDGNSFDDDEVLDETFEDWLLDHNIQYTRKDQDFYWLDSANFALYEELEVPEGFKEFPAGFK